MRKILLYNSILLLLLFVYSCSEESSSKFKRQKFEGMNGNVESFVECYHDASIWLGDTIKSDEFGRNIFYFNNNGFITLLEAIHRDEIVSKYVYTVSEDGINQKADYYKNDTLSSTLELILEKPNKLTYIVRYKNDTRVDTLQSIIDKEGNIIDYDLDDNKTITTLDEKGNVIKLLIFDKDGTLVSGLKYNRDNNGLEKDLIRQYGDNNIDSVKYIYRKFDNKNNWTERIEITKRTYSEEPDISISTREIKYR